MSLSSSFRDIFKKLAFEILSLEFIAISNYPQVGVVRRNTSGKWFKERRVRNRHYLPKYFKAKTAEVSE
jgi:hypothetical protein